MRTSVLRVTRALVLAMFYAALAEGQQPRQPAEMARAADAWAADLVRANQLSGTVLVARGDEILYHRAFGAGNRTDTPYAVASLTKPLTVILAMRLIEAGRLSLTDTIGTWLPGFPRAGRITVDMLMQHRSGIPHRVTQPDDENTRRTASDMVRLVALASPVFSPDSTRLYSSAGYSVLARVLELAGRASYARLLDSVVLAPAGAAGTRDATLGSPRNAPASLVHGSRGLVPAPAKDLSFLVGAGSVYTTPGDLFRIMRRLVAGGYGESAQRRLASANGDFSWAGVTNGYRAFADYTAGDGITVIFAGNLATGAVDFLRRDMVRLARGEAVAPPVMPAVTPIALSADLQRRYSGDYQIGGPVPLSFASPTLGLMGTYALIPTSDSTFFSPQDYATVRVETDAAGAVTALVWGEARFARMLTGVR